MFKTTIFKVRTQALYSTVLHIVQQTVYAEIYYLFIYYYSFYYSFPSYFVLYQNSTLKVEKYIKVYLLLKLKGWRELAN